MTILTLLDCENTHEKHNIALTRAATDPQEQAAFPKMTPFTGGADLPFACFCHLTLSRLMIHRLSLGLWKQLLPLPCIGPNRFHY